jgi:2-dehydro-3-deoxyphosphogluconate aldolase/(4S)-4-hydroxy-2-oxoglutarate aldolase
MDKRTEVGLILKEQGLLPLYFHASESVSAEVLRSLYQAGLRTVEYTNRGEEALSNFGVLRKVCDDECPGMFLGAGTIKDAAAARDFIYAGADFLVSPGLAEDVFDTCYSDKILWIPGCMTITEIMRAEQFGIEIIKLFPGSLLGPDFVKAIRDIFPALSFIPTGGVELEKKNLEEWFIAGVVAVGMGSKLITKEILEKKEYKKITELAGKAISIIKEVRK